MQRHPDYTRRRLQQLTERMQGRIYPQTLALEQLEISSKVERIAYEEALKLQYRPVKLGAQLGPLFASYWFRVQVRVPKAWAGQRVDLLWDTMSENTLWIDGQSRQGLNHSNGQDRMDAPLLMRAKGGEVLWFYIETACNDAFGSHGIEFPQHRSPVYLNRAEVGCFDALAWDIYHDLKVLTELEAEQVAGAAREWTFSGANNPGDLDKTWAGTLLFELNRFANELDEDDRSTWAGAQKILKKLLQQRNGSVTHQLSAIGHAHIDTAWLWPLEETVRKCTRTFSTQTSYMDQYPEYRFACSQAYQYWIMKERNPDLYQRMKAKVKTGQFIPVGGTWIEPDCNLPSGEALCRQFLLGQRFFEAEFGKRCTEFWNPDVFGYNGQLPQIMKLAGIERFLTQKLSWNWFNKPLYHTFYWQGIDGSNVLAHFPPADTYNAVGSVSEIRRHARNYKENAHSRHAMYLFGYGDGGGGPTKTMLESLRRLNNLQGVPQCRQRSSDEFFTLLEKDATDLPTVVGELYFELHRGTYTTQANTKKNNRKCEFLLHDIEFMSAMAARLNGHEYPNDDLTSLWRTVLLHQFHDILPGSSIRHVYADADQHYASVYAKGNPLHEAGCKALSAAVGVDVKQKGFTPINTIGFDRCEVAQQPDGQLVVAEAPSYGVGVVRRDVPEAVKVHVKADGKVVLENQYLLATLHKDGRLLSLVHKASGRQALSEPGNVLKLFNDRPTNWEAWDVDPWLHETGKPCPPATRCKVTMKNDLRVEVTFEHKLGRRSSLTQVVRLDAMSQRLEFHHDIDWQEARRMLKVSFPLNVRALNATYEMQFGSVERPTHCNDLLALAKYEVCGHKWADLSEHGFGVSLLSESKYGFTTRGNVMFMSLLRSTQSPDPKADLGRHQYAYALYPHQGDWRQGTVAEGYAFNVPLVWGKGVVDQPCALLAVDDANLVIDTVKKAEDSDALIVRLYEAHGSRGSARLKVNFPVKKAALVNLLEDETSAVKLADQTVTLDYTPYQIISVKLI